MIPLVGGNYVRWPVDRNRSIRCQRCKKKEKELERIPLRRHRYDYSGERMACGRSHKVVFIATKLPRYSPIPYGPINSSTYRSRKRRGRGFVIVVAFRQFMDGDLSQARQEKLEIRFNGVYESSDGRIDGINEIRKAARPIDDSRCESTNPEGGG